jgi:O-antigen/teichoic acid export membrane protein
MAALGWLKTQVTAPRTQALYDQLLVSGVNFLTVVYLGRRLAPEAFGVFTLAYLSVLGLATLQTALVTQPLNLLGATRPADVNLGHLHALLRLFGWVWLPLNLLFLGVLSWVFFPDSTLFLAAGVYLCGFLLQELLRRYWYTCGQIRHALVNDLIYAGQLPLILYVAQRDDFDPAMALMLMAFTSFLAMGHGAWRLRRTPSVPVSTRAVVDQHWRMGAWLLLATASAYGATQLYPYMLASVGAGAVAAFAAARNLLGALNVVVQAANNYLPIRSKQVLAYEGARPLSEYLRRAGIALALVAGGFCALLAWRSEELLAWVYGKSFEDAEQLLALLAVSGFCFALFPVFNAGILALNRLSVIFAANLVATIFNLSVGWWLIREYGVRGAAVAASVSMALVLVLQAWRLRQALARSATTSEVRPCAP